MLLVLLVAQPAVLLDPEAARAHARSPEAQPLGAAEAFILAGDPAPALEILATEAPTARRLRLEADAYVALHDPRLEEALAPLDADPAWAQHAAWARGSFLADEARASAARTGTICFALCLALLLLGAGKELVRIGPDGIVLGVVWLACVAFLGQISKPLMVLAGVIGGATLALAHAGTAMVRRSAAGPRGRVIVATVVLLGSGGAAFGVAYRVGLASALAPLL